MAIATQGTASNYLQRAPSPSGLADVVDLILDKGLVIDAYVRVAVIGIELVTIDARIVIASVDTYLRFAEQVNRLDLNQTELSGLPELREAGAEEVVEHKVEHAEDERDREDDERARERPPPLPLLPLSSSSSPPPVILSLTPSIAPLVLDSAPPEVSDSIS